LADTGTEGSLAKELSERSVAEYESQLKGVTLATLTDAQLKDVNSLSYAWDTMGWAAFRLGDLATAEKYINAAWLLSENAENADHLGQVYERQDKKAEAIHAYKLALAVTNDLPDTRERLEKLGGKVDAGGGNRPSLMSGGWANAPRGDDHPEDELPLLRTTPVPELKYDRGNAEFFLLFSVSGVDDVQFLRGDDQLKGAADALRRARYNMPFPDQGPAKIARRGLLSCGPSLVANCNFVFFLPANTKN
jgi:tetratricopeptide (TPR) repeat protein